jgi:hypothetical protein
MTFDEICTLTRATPAERDALAWHIAMFRARKTYDALKIADASMAIQEQIT